MSDKKLPVTVLCGFLGAGKTTLLKFALENQKGYRIAVIVNDMSELNIDAQMVAKGQVALQRGQESLVELSNGCICCTLRDDLLREVRRLADLGQFDYLLIESTGVAEPMPIAETFAFTDEKGEGLGAVAQLDTLVTVVDGPAFLRDFHEAADLAQKGLATSEEDTRNTADLLADQVEFANVLVINKCDGLEKEEVNSLKELLSRLNPQARILEATRGRVPLDALFNTGLFEKMDKENHPDWLQGHTHTPETEAYGISSFVFRANRPFHPQRLWDVVTRADLGLVRSKGFLWLATRNDLVAQWNLAGGTCGLEPAGSWWCYTPQENWPQDEEVHQTIMKYWDPTFGDRRQEMVVIGKNMDAKGVEKALEGALLTPQEVATGEGAWTLLEDPFPPWQTHHEGGDEHHDCDHDHGPGESCGHNHDDHDHHHHTEGWDHGHHHGPECSHNHGGQGHHHPSPWEGAGSMPPAALEAKAQGAFAQGHWEDALGWQRAQLQSLLSQPNADTALLAMGWLRWALIGQNQGEDYRVLAAWRAAIKLLETLPDTWMLCQAINGYLDSLRACGAPDRGLAVAQRGLEIAQKGGQKAWEATFALACGATYVGASDWAQARSFLNIALRLHEDMANNPGIGAVMFQWGLMEEGQGQLSAAKDSLERAVFCLKGQEGFGGETALCEEALGRVKGALLSQKLQSQLGG